MKLKFVLVLLVVLGFAVGCENKTELEWINPTQKVCKANGGEMYDYNCKAIWSDAKDICRASGGRLATIDELKKVVTDCGGTIKDYDSNKADAVYQDCYYKEKGFSAFGYYWSSTTDASNTGYAWVVRFYNGNTGHHYLSYNYYVRCVRSGQ